MIWGIAPSAMIFLLFTGGQLGADDPMPAEFDPSREEALAAFEKGDMEKALALFRNCLSRDPDDVDVLQKAGFILVKAEELAEARHCFMRALEAGDDKIYPLLELGNIAFREFELGEARWYYEEVLRIDPGNRQVGQNMALLDDRIAGVERLERVKSRCDLIFILFLCIAAVFLADVVVKEYRLLPRGLPLRRGSCSFRQ